MKQFFNSLTTVVLVAGLATGLVVTATASAVAQQPRTPQSRAEQSRAEQSRAEQRDSSKHAKISIPADARPPSGMCRIWIDGVPAAQQPAATDCSTAVKNRPANGRVVFGDDYADTSKSKAAEGTKAARDIQGFTKGFTKATPGAKPPPKRGVPPKPPGRPPR